MSALMPHDWNCKPLGWDHTNMKWYYPIWLELDDKLDHPSDGSRIRWRLDWGDGGGHDLEVSDISVCKTPDLPELVSPQGPGKDVQTAMDLD